MKFLLPFLAILIFTGCKPTANLISPNQMQNMQGTLYLNNGQSIDGRLTLNVTGFNRRSAIRILRDGARDAERYYIDEVKGYKMRNDYFELMEIRSNTGIGQRISFMRRLTAENSRIGMYENRERETQNDINNNNTFVRWNNVPYIQIPGEPANQVWSLESNRFTPNFDEKVSRMVADCPALARKIANKEEGYFYRQVSLQQNRRLYVMDNIIREYNDCK